MKLASSPRHQIYQLSNWSIGAEIGYPSNVFHMLTRRLHVENASEITCRRNLSALSKSRIPPQIPQITPVPVSSCFKMATLAPCMLNCDPLFALANSVPNSSAEYSTLRRQEETAKLTKYTQSVPANDDALYIRQHLQLPNRERAMSSSDIKAPATSTSARQETVKYFAALQLDTSGSSGTGIVGAARRSMRR